MIKRMFVMLLCVLLLSACGGGGGGSDSSSTPLPVANTAPVANAGITQSVSTGTLVTLDGSASSDVNGDTLTYSWSITFKPAGSNAVLSNLAIVNPSFNADLAGTYVLSLVVNDGKLNSVSSTVTVNASVNNTLPVANAGTAKVVATGSVVTLDGSGSSDDNGDTLSYSWTLISKPAGSHAVLLNATTIKPKFTADIAGHYVLNLIVNDGKVNSATASVAIEATSDPSKLFTTSSTSSVC